MRTWKLDVYVRLRIFLKLLLILYMLVGILLASIFGLEGLAAWIREG